MPKATRTLSGAARDKYFRDMFGAEGGLPKEVADRLLLLCKREISQLRVREPIPFRAPARAPTPSVETSPSATAQLESTEVEPAAVDTFDPYAFSLVSFFRRSGREALMSRLSQIEAANLRKLAEAQHVMVGPEITDADALRNAIVEGTEQRLADRRAAAS